MSYTNGSHSRISSATSETKSLRESVVRLQQELVHSRAETQKATDQLNCLIMLVKKAWRGDKTASIHVANIVGAAPPDLEEEYTSDMKIVLSARPKNRATNNWALLTIGLLNRNYKRMEDMLQEKQIQHLQHRYDHLQEELIRVKDAKARQPSLGMRRSSMESPERTNPLATQEYKMAEPSVRKERQGSASSKKKLPLRHLYRSPQKGQGHPGVTWGDLVVDNNTRTTSNQVFDGLYHMTAAANKQKMTTDPDRTEIDWDDHQKYTKTGLYESERVVGSEAMQKRRPISASSLKHADKKRSRPKSGVIAQKGSGRPLKYETTRPVSAPNRVKSATHRVPTGKPTYIVPIDTSQYGEDFFMTKESDIEDDMDMKDNMHTAEETDPDLRIPKMSVNIKQPESVLQLVNDLDKMNMMENDFKKSTVSLQRKLGISGDAMVY